MCIYINKFDNTHVDKLNIDSYIYIYIYISRFTYLTIEERLESQAIEDNITSKYILSHVDIFYCLRGPSEQQGEIAYSIAYKCVATNFFVHLMHMFSSLKITFIGQRVE